MRFLIFIVQFIEVLVVAFMIWAAYGIINEPKIDEKKVKREADKESNENLDKLNNLDYLDKFEDSTAVDSTAKRYLR
jgi:hypothetical protein